MHLIIGNSGHKCVFLVQGLPCLPNTHFILFSKAHRKHGSHKQSINSAWGGIKLYLVVCNIFTDTFLFAASLHRTTGNVSVTHANNRLCPLIYKQNPRSKSYNASSSNPVIGHCISNNLYSYFRKHSGQVISLLDLKSSDPKFKSHSDHQLDWFQVVPGPTPCLCL